MYLGYQILIIIMMIIAGPYLLIRAIIEKQGIRERLGLWEFKPDDRKVVWFHAASMGELKAIDSVLPELIKIYPELRIIVTTITKTGRERAHELFSPMEIFYLPVDLRCCVNRVLRLVKPSLLILVETELWPVLIKQARESGAKIAVVNGRISQKSYKFYYLFKSLFSAAISKIDYIMPQAELDKRRFSQLGAAPERLEIRGNIKFDQIFNGSLKPPADELDNYLNRHGRFVFIAGSIWPKEFKSVLKVYKELSEIHPELTLVLAPRHMKNLGRLEETLQLDRIAYFKRSQLIENSQSYNVMVVDTMGELSGLYRYADLAFVGGSFVNIGGHDPLEPASSGCPVCFGPHMENSQTFVDILVESGGAFYLNTQDDLYSLLLKLLEDKALAKELGRKARQAVLDHSGVSKNIARKLAEFI